MKTRRIGKHRECVQTGKACFNTFENAWVRIGKIMEKSASAAQCKWNAYTCKACGRIHITSNRKRGFVARETRIRQQRLNGS